MRKYRHNDKQAGFTLIELMTALVIGGILMAIGIPAFGDMVKNNRLTAQTNSLLTALHLARNEAINRGHDIRVLSLSGGTNWASGWEVRLDVNNNGVTNNGTTVDTVLRSFDPIKKATLAGTANNITYEPTGFVSAINTITLTADGCAHQQKRVISVKLSGLLTSKKQSC